MEENDDRLYNRTIVGGLSVEGKEAGGRFSGRFPREGSVQHVLQLGSGL